MDSRSTIAPQNLQALLDAAASPKAAVQAGQQQYSTPTPWAEFFNQLLPDHYPAIAFDPQCAGGNLFTGFGYACERLGWDIDQRFTGERDRVRRLTGNCVKLWELLDELYPNLRFECQVANPPFGIQWKVPVSDNLKSTVCDSTLHTWRMIQARAPENGHGYFIANRATIERLGLHQEPRVYLYQTFPAGLFPKTTVEVGVIHWHNSPDRFRPSSSLVTGHSSLRLDYQTLDPKEHAAALRPVREHFAGFYYEDAILARSETIAAWTQLETILKEEARHQPTFNLWLDPSGCLRLHLSTRTQIKRKLSQDDLKRLLRVDECHPLTLTTEVETRKLLNELISCGFYTVEPAARQAIQEALASVASLATPIMPVTDFECVAYADEMESLLCVAPFPQLVTRHSSLLFTPGQRYAVTTATYTFVEQFNRNRVHFDEESGQTWTAPHSCSLSGQDRYIALIDDQGKEHRFMDRPKEEPGARFEVHPECMLWEIFAQPEVKTVAEAHPDAITRNRQHLLELQQRIDRHLGR